MSLALLLMAASAASADPRPQTDWRNRILLAVNEEAAAPQDKADAVPEAQDAKIEHAPLEKTPRGQAVWIKAKVGDASQLFSPLVFARKSGTTRYEAFTMKDRGRKAFLARLPPSILSDGSFEYFIEAQHEQGGATRLGSPRKPFNMVAFDPPPAPVAFTFTTVEPGAAVRLDDNDIGKTPLTINLLPGPHTVAVTAADGRSAEQHLDVKPGRKEQNIVVELPRQTGGPATLSVASDPPNANVLLDGAVMGRTPYQEELSAGEHVVAVEMAGRMREERRVVAREGRDANVSFVLAPLPKDPALAVESEPIGAMVLLDGKEKGRTPFLAPLATGRHQLVLKMEGHREVGTDFTMPRDRDLSIRLDLPVGAGTGSRLTLTSVPSGATAALDGKEIGITPWAGEVRPGSHKISITSKGYRKEERNVQVQPNRDADLTFALNREPGPGKLHIETDPPEALVSIDGEQAGTSPFTGDIAPGDHQLEASKEGYKTIAQQLSIDRGQHLSLKLAMQPAQAGQVPPLIAAASDPQGAQLYLDGKLMGTTGLKFRSTPGPHEIKLALDGYVTRSGKINLPENRDFELRMAISLKPVRGVEEKHEAPSARELARAQALGAYACSRQGDYQCALKSYQKAYEYEQRPILLFNIAQMRRKMGQFKEASAVYLKFLREVPAGQEKARDEATKQLAFCELKLKAPEPAAAVAAGGTPVVPATARVQPREEEDTDAPLLTHVPVKRAVRGQPVRLTARIVDERSGVGTRQACWRNLYRKEFECQPMARIGEDEYGIDVPAKAVSDGFAYYLEAYDNNDNGPARSGAPELPNALVVEDAPAPKPMLASVTEDATRLAAPAAMVAPAMVAPAALPPAALPATEHARELPPRKSHLISYIAIGSALAAVVAASALTVEANNSSNDLNGYPPDRANTLRTRIDNDRLIAKVLFGVGGAFAIGAISLWNF